jgi:hypothetical protein
MNQACLVALVLLGLSMPTSLIAAQPTPRYTNAELVSVNAQTRLVVVRNTDGREQTLKLDDSVAGLEGLRVGDRVILSLREERGMARISSITKSQSRPASVNPPPPRPPDAEGAPVAMTIGGGEPPPPGGAATTPPIVSPLNAFADQVAEFAIQAGRVDGLWNDFKTSCNVILRSSYADGRDWFSLWEGTSQIDVSGGACRDLFNQVVEEGQKLKAAVAGAEEAARKADASPGALRDVLRRHSLEWGGWALPAPDPLKQ